MKKIKIFLTTAILATLTSCVNGDDYDAPEVSCVGNATVTTTVSAITTATNSNLQQWTGNDIIEAHVTSSDEGGNFYKSVSFVATDGSASFSMPIDSYNLYTKYEPGRKVFINMKNLYYQTKYDGVVIGNLYNGNTPNDISDDAVGRIPAVSYQDIIMRSCTKVNEDDIVKNLTLTQALDDQYINQLIEFDNVQFASSSVGSTFYDENNAIGGATNHTLRDADGNTVTIRTSSYANFATEVVPEGNGKIRCVLTKYISSSGTEYYQFMLRTINDVMLDNPTVDFSFLDAVNEDFESYSTNTEDFNNYYNESIQGSRKWEVRAYGGNQYIQLSSYNSGEANRAMFIIPVKFDVVSTMSFKTKDGYNNGNPLKVYYSTDLDTSNPGAATLTDITSNFTLAIGSTSGYATNFTNSGVYNFSGLSGNGYIIFEYTGNGSGVTTTFQIDDIAIN